MSEDSVDRVFEKAIVTIQTLSSQKGYNSLPRPPAHVRIQLYALFKQATEGDVKDLISKPIGNPTSPEYNLALRKWEAWKSKEGLSIIEAKKAYIELLIHTMKTYAMGTIVARELLSELEFMWWQITRSNSFDGHESSDYQDETNSIMMITNDIDTYSDKLRKEVYQTLSSLRSSPSGTAHTAYGGDSSNGNGTYDHILKKFKRVLHLLARSLSTGFFWTLRKLLVHALFLVILSITIKHFTRVVKVSAHNSDITFSSSSNSLKARQPTLSLVLKILRIKSLDIRFE